MKYYTTSADCEQGFRSDPSMDVDEFAAARQQCHSCVASGNIFVATPTDDRIVLGCQARLPGKPQQTERASIPPLALAVGFIGIAWWAFRSKR